MNQYHEPVLVNEILQYLHVEKGKKYIDATLGDGGHTLEILKKGGKVLGIDYSEISLKNATQRITAEKLDSNFTPVFGNFAQIYDLARSNDFSDVSGILFDLGYSSTQLENEHGMSFLLDEPLDMRIDKNLGVTAADLVNALSEKDLENLLRNFGDERMAKKFAQEIVNSRKLKKIETTKCLADIIKASAPLSYDNSRIHPATRTFMALRIAVNNELDNLKNALPLAAQLLKESKLPGGRMLVISFHSLEDSIVKQFGRSVQPALSVVTRKPVIPTEAEVRTNSRARSAKLRVFEKSL
jgi:16S rRNA (cytosine1402-N4)-methyltransferase